LDRILLSYRERLFLQNKKPMLERQRAFLMLQTGKMDVGKRYQFIPNKYSITNKKIS